MLDGLQPQKLDAGALSVGALARLMREERQRQPDKKIHLVLDVRAAEAVGWAGGAAWCRQVGAAHVYALGAARPAHGFGGLAVEDEVDLLVRLPLALFPKQPRQGADGELSLIHI